MGFSADEVSTDGAALLTEKPEREHRMLRYFSQVIPDRRDPLRIVHPIEKLLKQRVFTMVQGYQDANDVQYLKNDPLLKDILEGEQASQPTMSRFENSLDKHAVFALCHAWIDRYVSTLANRDKVVIDIDGTDDPTHGEQQLSMFNGYYGQFMYNELFFHDGIQGKSLSRYCARGTATQIDGMLPF